MPDKNFLVERLKNVGRLSSLSESPATPDYNFRTDLFLRTCPDKTRVWMQNLKIKNLKKEISLGDFPEMSFSQARHLAACNRKLIARGLSPFPRKISDSDLQFRDQIKSMITQADQSAQRKAEPQHQAEIIPIRPAQKSAPLDLSPYKVQPTSTIDDSKKEMPKALFAAQVEILISNDEKAPYEETEEISTLDKVPEPILSTRNAEELVNDAGANLSVLAKALALNAQTRDQKDRIYNSCLALLDEHGPDLLDSACNQALVAGTSSLSAVVSVIRKQTTDDTKFHPKPPVTIAHSNIRGAGYFN